MYAACERRSKRTSFKYECARITSAVNGITRTTGFGGQPADAATGRQRRASYQMAESRGLLLAQSERFMQVPITSRATADITNWH
jgi:hypothetical protein